MTFLDDARNERGEVAERKLHDVTQLLADYHLDVQLLPGIERVLERLGEPGTRLILDAIYGTPEDIAAGHPYELVVSPSRLIAEHTGRTEFLDEP